MGDEHRIVRDSGFSLIEVVVALGVFSLALISLLELHTQNTRSTLILHEKTLARFAAHNEMVRAVVRTERSQSSRSVEEEMLGYVFQIEREVTPTDQAGLERVEISVMSDGDQTHASLVGFRRAAR